MDGALDIHSTSQHDPFADFTSPYEVDNPNEEPYTANRAHLVPGVPDYDNVEELCHMQPGQNSRSATNEIAYRHYRRRPWQEEDSKGTLWIEDDDDDDDMSM